MIVFKGFSISFFFSLNSLVFALLAPNWWQNEYQKYFARLEQISPHVHPHPQACIEFFSGGFALTLQT